MRRLTITVIGDSYIERDVYEFCENIGVLLAELDVVVITGGRGGVMEAVSKGAVSAGGLTLGILPSENKDDANPYCSIVIPTGLGHARNAITAMASDIVLVIGGGAGTLTEMGFSWIYNKPILAFKKFGGWASRLSDSTIDKRRNDLIRSVNDLDELKNEISRISSELRLND